MKNPIIEYFENGKVAVKKWLDVHEVYHRENDMPAYACYYSTNGNLAYLEWRKHGLLHRKGNPAQIVYWDGGQIHYKEWRINDKRHRNEDKPAFIQYYNEQSIN